MVWHVPTLPMGCGDPSVPNSTGRGNPFLENFQFTPLWTHQPGRWPSHRSHSLAILPTAATGLGHVLKRRWFVGPTALVWISASLAGWLLAGTGCQEKPPALPDQASTFFESVRVIDPKEEAPDSSSNLDP